MHTSTIQAALIAALAGLAATTAAQSDHTQPPNAQSTPTHCGLDPDTLLGLRCQAPPVIQLAICLDTSGSMQGLLNQARTRIWAIVNELHTARRHGIAPTLEVAIYQYGSDQHPAAENFTACVLPFTSDLDAVGAALFDLSIDGSNEYCGAVVRAATEQLEWTATGEGSLRLLVIAGNEPFTQGPVDYRSAVPAAVERGVIINTIYCGPDHEGQATGWLHAAHLAGGDYAVIEQDKVIAPIHCPQDEPLRRLNDRLNSTYLHHNAQGRQNLARMQRVDEANAQADSSALLDRIQTKTSDQYTNTTWDVVGLYRSRGARAVTELDRASFAEPLQKLSDDELVEAVSALAEERAAIQAEIHKLAAEREAFLRAERARRSITATGTLDNELLQAIRKQTRDAGFEYPEPSIQ